MCRLLWQESHRLSSCVLIPLLGAVVWTSRLLAMKVGRKCILFKMS